jgi:hypothetical protein
VNEVGLVGEIDALPGNVTQQRHQIVDR